MQQMRLRSSLWVSVLSAAALATSTGCYYGEPRYRAEVAYGYPPPPAYAEAYTYYYYPDCEVYFDVRTHDYFWFEAGVWRTGPRRPPTIVIRPETRVVVKLDTRQPYTRHTEIRAKYPGPPPHAPAWGWRRKQAAQTPTIYRYQYYPDAQVYYRPERRTYYWAERGNWRSSTRPPPNVGLRSQARVDVDLDSPEPSKHHEQVRAQHPGRALGHEKHEDEDAHGKGKHGNEE